VKNPKRTPTKGLGAVVSVVEDAVETGSCAESGVAIETAVSAAAASLRIVIVGSFVCAHRFDNNISPFAIFYKAIKYPLLVAPAERRPLLFSLPSFYYIAISFRNVSNPRGFAGADGRDSGTTIFIN